MGGPGEDRRAALPTTNGLPKSFQTEFLTPALDVIEVDSASADEWGLDLVRPQTCMQGASHCDFRYRLRKP